MPRCILSLAARLWPSAESLITRVLFNKTTATGRRLLIVDASMTQAIRPMLYGSYHNIENITASTDEEPRVKYTIVGTACESTDVFGENYTMRTSRRGDLLTVKSAGAYGMSMASRYNLHDLPAAVYSDRSARSRQHVAIDIEGGFDVVFAYCLVDFNLAYITQQGKVDILLRVVFLVVAHEPRAGVDTPCNRSRNIRSVPLHKPQTGAECRQGIQAACATVSGSATRPQATA